MRSYIDKQKLTEIYVKLSPGEDKTMAGWLLDCLVPLEEEKEERCTKCNGTGKDACGFECWDYCITGKEPKRTCSGKMLSCPLKIHSNWCGGCFKSCPDCYKEPRKEERWNKHAIDLGDLLAKTESKLDIAKKALEKIATVDFKEAHTATIEFLQSSARTALKEINE